MTLNALMMALVAELVAEGVPDPLAQPLTLGAVWDDLCRLAGETRPTLLAALALDAPAPPLPGPEPTIRRGSYLGHAAQFPELHALPTGDLTITDILARCPHTNTGRGW